MPREDFTDPAHLETWLAEGNLVPILVVGNNAKGFDVDALAVQQPILRELLFGDRAPPHIAEAAVTGRLVLMFGGDRLPAAGDPPNVANVLQWMQQELSLPLVAVANKEAHGVDDHVDRVLTYCETTPEGRTVWGGVKGGVPVGGTRIYLSPRVRLGGVVAMGGGGISATEVQYALEQGLAPVAALPVPSAVAFEDGGFGGPVADLLQRLELDGKLLLEETVGWRSLVTGATVVTTVTHPDGTTIRCETREGTTTTTTVVHPDGTNTVVTTEEL